LSVFALKLTVDNINNRSNGSTYLTYTAVLSLNLWL